MRRSLLLFLLAAILVLTFLLHTVSPLIALLFEDASADAIHLSELPALDSAVSETRPQLIPKIIHQTYINETIPAHWVAAQQSCLDLHPDYEYKLWTDALSHNFIKEKYPWFLATFEGYKHNIQRADAIRYFVLAHYGGIYIDLDDGCQRRLDPLLSYTAWVRRTIPTGISNDVMGAVPQHPFFLRVTKTLDYANRNWALPYITIMASTGPLFLSVVWKKWLGEHSNLDSEDYLGRVRVLMPDEYNDHAWSFFKTYEGSSWHGKDARFIFWLGRNWMLVFAVSAVLVLWAGFAAWSVYARFLAHANKKKYGGSPRLTTDSGPSRLSLWTRWGGNHEPRKNDYELVEQHDA